MSREEFLTELRKALQGRVSQQTVNDNLRYYEEYILTVSQKGMDGQETASGEYSFKKIKIRIWLILATVFLFVILLIILLAQVVAFLLPVLLPVAIIFFLFIAMGMNKRF